MNRVLAPLLCLALVLTSGCATFLEDQAVTISDQTGTILEETETCSLSPAEERRLSELKSDNGALRIGIDATDEALSVNATALRRTESALAAARERLDVLTEFSRRYAHGLSALAIAQHELNKLDEPGEYPSSRFTEVPAPATARADA